MADEWRNKYQVLARETDLLVPKEWELQNVDSLIEMMRQSAIRQGQADPSVHVNTLNGIPIAVGVGGWFPQPISPPANTPASPILIFKPLKPAIASHGRWHGTYAEYTATPEFQRIAAAARKEWNYHCLIDRNHKGRIEMHHRDYRNVPFGEDWRDLIPLCEDCHHLYHGRLLKPPIGLFDEIAPRKVA